MAKSIKAAVERFLDATQRFSEVVPLVAVNETDAKEIACLAKMYRDEMHAAMRSALRNGNTNAVPGKEVFDALDKMDELLNHVEDTSILYRDDAIEFNDSQFAGMLRNLNTLQLQQVLAELPGVEPSPPGLTGVYRQTFLDTLVKQQEDSGEGGADKKPTYNKITRVVHGLRWLPSRETIKRWKALGLPVFLALLAWLGVPLPPGLAAVPGELKLQAIDNFLDGLGIFFPGGTENSGNCEITVTAKSVTMTASPDDIEDWGEIVIQFEVDGTNYRWPQTGVFEPSGATFSLGDTVIGKFTKPGCGTHTFKVKARFMDLDQSLIPFDEDDVGTNQKTVTLDCGAETATHELNVTVYEGGDQSDSDPITAKIKFEVSSKCVSSGGGTAVRAG